MKNVKIKHMLLLLQKVGNSAMNSSASCCYRDTWVREIDAASKQYKDLAKRKLERVHSGIFNIPSTSSG